MSTTTLQQPTSNHLLHLSETTLNRQEIEFIVCLSRHSLSADSLCTARKLADSNLNWNFVYEAACFHGVFPAFFKNIKKHFWDALPVRLANALTLHNSHLSHQTLALVGTFLAFQEALERADIESAIFKGPALAATAYGDLLLRDFSDVDVLVAKQDVTKVQQMLLDMGYAPAPHRDPPLSNDFIQSDEFLNMTCEHTFTRGSPQGLIDLHWQIQPWHVLPIETHEVLENLVSINIENRQIKTLEPNLLFVVLAVHASKHRWERLLWICDTAELLNSQQFDWQKVFSIANRLRVTDMVALALMLANRIYGSPIPQLPKTTDMSKLEQMCSEILANMSLLDMEGQHGFSLRSWRFCTSLKNGTFDKVRYLATEFLKPGVNDYVRLRLPRPLFFCYYILHPVWIFYDAIARRTKGIPEPVKSDG